MSGFHFMALDSQLRKLTQIYYIIFAGLMTYLCDGVLDYKPGSSKDYKYINFAIF